jgi:Phage P22-like portal protein
MKKILREFFGRPETDEEPSDVSAVRPNIELPDDFDSESTFLAHMRTEFYEDIQYDRLNRESAIDDLRFMVGDQWEDYVRQRRESARKPVMTVNRLPAFVAQVVGARRMSESVIKILPDTGGTKAVARIREDLVRAVQKESRAEMAFDKAFENQIECGIGNFKLELDYASDDVFDQKMMILPINDALSTVWDRKLMDPTGRDATHVFDVDTLKSDEFKKRWPWASPADIVVDVTLRGDLRMNGWIAIDDVRVVKYYRLKTRKRTLAMLVDQRVLDITDLTDDEKPGFDAGKAKSIMSQIATRPDGTPIMRVVDKPYVEMYICSGLDILEGPYRLNCSRVPVFRVPGWEVTIGEWKHRWGLIRFLKDPQRLHNFWRSVIAEKLMQTPRATWMASQSSVAGREKQWRESHLSDDPLLIWNDESGNKPERVPPANMEGALMEQAEFTTQDLKDVSNIHEANLGMPSNEVSGAAIQARQRVSDTGTTIYHDNLTLAQEECGRVMNELFGDVYDTARVVKTVGEDAKENMVAINQVGQPETDITIGKYSVTVKTGPNSATKRIESAENMMNLMNAMPQVGAVIADLVVKAQDWPGADEIARRLELVLPPGILDPKDMTPEQQQRAQGAQQAAQQAQQDQRQMLMAQYLKTSSEAQLNTARAAKFASDVQLDPQKLDIQMASEASQEQDRQLRGHLETIRVADGK